MSWDPRSGEQRPSPFVSPPMYEPYGSRPRSSKAWVLLLLGGGLFVVLFCCGGGYGLFAIVTSVMAAGVKEQIRDNAKLREHIGEIQSVKLDISSSLALEGNDTFRYEIRGTKGTGELTVTTQTNDDGDEVIEKASLRLPDGTTVQLVP